MDADEERRQANARRNRECYARNREQHLARRRQLYALNNGKEKTLEYYHKMKENEQFKKRRALASLKHYYKKEGLSWPPNEKELEERRIAANRKRGNSILEYHKKHKKEVFQTKKAQIERVVEIPDLSKAWGDTPQLFPYRPPPVDAIQVPGFNPFS